MVLLVLGSGTGMPNPARSPSGYLVNADGKNILFDSGPGTLQRLIRYDVTYSDIDYILYSHLHPDHTLGFPEILFAARNPKNPRKKDLTVIGPRGIREFYDNLLNLYPGVLTSDSYKLVFREVGEGDLDIEKLKIRTKTVAHTENSLGFRLETREGKSFVYSGDTGYCDNVVKLAEKADILVLDCSAPDEHESGGHLTPSLAGKIATMASAKKLILSHLYPICERYPILKQCKKTFKGRVVIAKDGMRVKI